MADSRVPVCNRGYTPAPCTSSDPSHIPEPGGPLLSPQAQPSTAGHPPGAISSPPLDGSPFRLDCHVDITRNFIRAKSPCADGFRWYLRNHAEVSDYQGVLDSLVMAGRVDDACWLLAQLGPTNAVLQVESIDAEAVVFAGTIDARRGIEVGSIVRAGRSIRSGGGVRAGTSIVAGEDIWACGNLYAGDLIDAAGDIYAAWSIEAAGNIHCTHNLRAMRDLTCKGNLEAQGNILVGEDLSVDGTLRCAKGLRVDGALRAGQDVRAGEGILCNGAIECGGHLDAGWGIKAGDAMVAAGAIRAGESLAADGEIRAGAGYGVFAGLCVQRETWECSARVSACARPQQLMSGWWVETAAVAHAAA